jgi:pyrophosphatase PpaX
MQPPAAVLFDLDGTLIDSITLIAEAARHAFSACDVAAPADADWLSDLGLPLRAMFARFAEEGRIEELIGHYREYQVANHDRLVSCYAEIPEVVGSLKELGYTLGVVTSKSERLADRGLTYTQLKQYFDTIVGLESCVRHKPDPEPVITALGRLGFRPEDSIFVGDSPYDMAAGRAAGTAVAAALWGPFTRAQLELSTPELMLERPSDLLRGLEQLGTEGNRRAASE